MRQGPFQRRVPAGLDARSDQYALGCVLYEMLIGEPPFTGLNTAQILAKKLSESPSRISSLRSSVNPQIDEVIRRALSTTPADRFPSVRQFSDALQGPSVAFATAEVGSGPAARPLRKKRPWTIRWLASTATLAIMVFVGGMLFLGSTNDLGFQHRDWILITNLQNNTGESVFDRSLDNALTVGLQQSHHVNVFPKARVSQTLTRMLREDTGALDEEVGREVALRENIRLLVVPSIDQIDQTFLLALRVVDTDTGEDLLSRSESAEGASEVVSSLDRLAKGFRRDLGESRFSISRQSVPLGAATTSIDAAHEQMEAVVELAHSASVAPSWLADIGKVQARNGLAEDSQLMLQAALEREDEGIQADRASVEHLRGEVALATGDSQSAVAHLRTAYALRENAHALESLAYALYRSGELDEALSIYLELLEEPDIGWEVQDFWIISHIHVGEIYEELGDLSKAREYYEAFLEIWEAGDPDLVALRDVRERVARLDAGG